MVMLYDQRSSIAHVRSDDEIKPNQAHWYWGSQARFDT